MGDVDFEVMRSDQEGATQVYHLKAWRVAETTSLVIPASLQCDDHLTQTQTMNVAALQQ